MATFNIILDKRSTKGEQKHHLTVRISNKKDIIYLRLGPMMSIKEYDTIFKKVSYNSGIENVKKKYDKYLERAKKIFPLIDPFDSSKFRELYYDKDYNHDVVISEKDNVVGSIKFMYEKYLETETANGRLSIGTADVYNYNKRSLLKFKSDLTFEDITPEFLHGFENWFLSKTNSKGKTNSQATVGNIFRSLRCIINYYKKKKVIPATYEYPGKSTQIDPLPPKQTNPLAPFQTDPLIPAQIDPLK